MPRARWFIALAMLTVIIGAGCRKDKRGLASLSVSTTLPEGIEITLVSKDRPGTYVEKVKSDLGGTLHYIGVVPGNYTLVYQFVELDRIPSHTGYNYGESDPIVVNAGRNNWEWTVDTGKMLRTNE